MTRSFALALIAFAFFWSEPLLGQMNEWAWTGSLPAGAWVKVFSGHGPIEVTAVGGETVQVVAMESGGSGGGDPVRFEVLRDGPDIVICALTDYTECGNDGIRMAGGVRSHTPDEVRFTVHVPRHAHTLLSTGNGEVSVEGVEGDVTARTGNGDVRLTGSSRSAELSSGNGALTVEEATGPVRAHTGNGPINLGAVSGSVWGRTGNGAIQVSVVSVADDADLHLRTGNGRVQLDLPADFSADLVARLSQGALISDFPLTMEGRWDFRNLEATIGHGGAQLTVVSGSGDLVLRVPPR